MADKRVTVILPALDEEETVGRVIDEIPREAIEGRGYGLEVMVVDNGSTDRTREIAEAKGATVLVEPERGKGRAVRAAFRSVDADYVIMLDADYTYPATHIPVLLDVLESGIDVVMCSRFRGERERGAMSGLNLTGNVLLSLMGATLYLRRVSDVCTGCWGFKGEVVKCLSLRSNGFGLEAELFAQLCKAGRSIAEVPIEYRRRPTAPKLNSLRDGVKIGLTLIRERFR